MMTSDDRNVRGGESKRGAQRTENLALLYQGLLTGIVRMQSGRQHVSDGESFRSRTKTALQEVERDAIAAGYDGADIRETHFAIVAFLDSVVLNSNEPIRAEWERRTLQEELVGKAEAGVVFFEKLDLMRSRRDSQELADVLEVYLLCLLLGFEGKYSGAMRGELYSVQDKIRARILDIRGRSYRLSPNALLEDNAPEELMAAPRKTPYVVVMIGAAAVTLLLYLAAKLQLVLIAEQIRSRLS